MKIKDLRKIRKNQSLTIYDIAKKSGLSHTTVSRIESGVHGVSVNSAKKLAGLYGLPLETFLDTVDFLQRQYQQRARDGDGGDKEEE